MNQTVDHASKSYYLSRLWIVSVVFEPLLIFLIADPSQAGISIGLARVLQVMVLLLLFCEVCLGRIILIYKDDLKIYLPLIGLLGYIFIVTLVNIAIDAYQFLSMQPANLQTNVFTLGAFPRVVIEFLVLIYNLIYFVVLAPVFLRRRNDINFFIKSMMYALSMHFVLGWLDFLLVALGGIEFLPRHLSDLRHVGVRFHGIAGEPRDAAVFMLCLFFFFSVKNVFEGNKRERISYPMAFLLGASVLATVSATAFVAIAISFFFVLVYSHQKINIKRTLITCFTLVFALFFSIYFITKIERLDLYVNTYGGLFWSLIRNPLQDLPPVVLVSFNNVYPLIVMVNEIMDFNIFGALFGSGLGGSGLVNAEIYSHYQNPNSQVIRLLYEYGLLGSLAYVLSIVVLVKRAADEMQMHNSRILLYSALIMLGGAFAHRSAFYLILCGFACATASWFRRNKSGISDA